MHEFTGKWITTREFAPLKPRNVFHRQLDRKEFPSGGLENRHILFRRRFVLDAAPREARMYITADDYYKLSINGRFVTQGPAPAYPTRLGWNEVDVTDWLREGENVLAVHTLYQGLINRVWVSGDFRHGLLCDLVADGKTVLSSDESFLVHPHTGYTATGKVGYDTQFMETYDSAAPETGFEQPGFDDSGWENASLREHIDYGLEKQRTKSLVFEEFAPVVSERRGDVLYLDFGANRVGYLCASAKGRAGEELLIRCGQELNDDGTVRYALRANCVYEEKWRLSGGDDRLDWFDYKCFRYAELTLPEGCAVSDVMFRARHYPFELKARMNPAFAENERLIPVWNLCVQTQKYGVQEVIQDCMEREKGFYVGDGCYTALTNMLLTGDDSIVRKLIRDALDSRFITPTMVTCLDCAMMQEIAEYSLMLISLMLWHYRLTGDEAFLRNNYEAACRLLENYRADYERGGLLGDLDKWCVVEWPKNFQDNYDVDITEGKVCHEPHVVMNAYYIEAVRCANAMARALGLPEYRDEAPLVQSFTEAFYDSERKLFTDSRVSAHASYIGNVFAFAFALCPEPACRDRILEMIEARGLSDVSMFGSFPMLVGLVRHDRMDLVERFLGDDGTWHRMLREGGTATFEGWGKETKWNTSLFHMTLSDGAVFLSDTDLKALFAH